MLHEIYCNEWCLNKDSSLYIEFQVSLEHQNAFVSMKTLTEDDVTEKTHRYMLQFQTWNTSIGRITCYWCSLYWFYNSRVDDFCTFASNSVRSFSKISRGAKSPQSRRFEAESWCGIYVPHWTYKKTLFNVDRTNWLWFFRFEYAAGRRCQFHGYLRKLNGNPIFRDFHNVRKHFYHIEVLQCT